MRRYFATDEDAAASEAIGFILIFGLVMVGIGLVTVYGYPALLQQQANSDQRIMEKNMIVLQNDIKSLCYKTVPFKETSLKVGGGSLTVYNAGMTPQYFRLTFTDSTPTAVDYRFYPGEMRYQTNEQGIIVTIENGAVIYWQPSATGKGSTMLAEPRWFYDSPTQTSVIYLIGINATEIIGKSGVGTVQMELARTNFTLYTIPAGNTITVEYQPSSANDYSTAWNNYFANTLKYTDNGMGGYELPPTQTLVVKEYDVLIRSV